MVSLHSGVFGALGAAALSHIFYVISSKVHLPRIEFLHGQNPSTFDLAFTVFDEEKMLPKDHKKETAISFF